MNDTSNPLLFQLRIDRLAYGGDGIARLPDGMTAFVPGALPGELVEAEVILKKRNFARCRLHRIIETSPERIEAQCPYFFTPAHGENFCPGCTWLHLSYQDEIRYKQEQFASFLLRDDLIEASAIMAPAASAERFGMRNKLKLSRGDNGYGYYRQDNETVISVSDCLLAAKEIRQEIADLHKNNNSPQVTLRQTAKDGVIVCSGTDAPGRVLTETLGDFGEFQVSETGFFQTNIQMATLLTGRVVSLLKENGCRKLLELYCGVGVFSIAAAGAIPQLCSTGVEVNPAAIASAKINAANHKVSERCRFFAADAARWLKKERKRLQYDSVLIDPPRSGMAKDALETLAAARIPNIIYVSCAPDTLRRDLLRLREYGYHAATSGMLDMFPGTAHFESVTLLKLKNF